MTNTEKDTEYIVRDFYSQDENLIIQAQPRLNGASKNGTGFSGAPEFIIKHKHHPDISLVVECKRDVANHSKAEAEAFHYSNFTSEPNKAILAVSGIGSNTKISLAVKNKLTSTYEKFDKMISFDEIIESINRDEKSEEKTIEETITYAKGLHNYLRDHVALSEAQKPLLIAAIMMALENDAFKDSYTKYEKSDCKLTQKQRQDDSMGELVFAIIPAASKVLAVSGIPKNKRETVTKELAFINSIIPLFKKNKENGNTHIFKIIEGLDKHLFGGSHASSDLDLLGKFYGEFISYTGGDGSGLGIVLTPNHVTDLMCELSEINADSVVYDPCTGTGGFLITAMNRMMEAAKGNEAKIAHIKSNQLHGVEMNSAMYTLAVANMIFKGDGKANMLNGSCFDLEPMIIADKNMFTTAILNPPYGLKAKGLREIDFILHACRLMERNGKITAIVPKSVFMDKKNLLAKKELLKNHTIESVISMPKDLFYPVATHVVIVTIRAHRPTRSTDKTYFYDMKDDGFKMVMKKGRQNFNYSKVKSEFFDAFDSKIVTPGKSAYEPISAEDEWIIEAFAETDYTVLNDAVFAKFELNKRISQLRNNSFSKLDPIKKPILTLDVANWKEFNYTDVFEMSRGKDSGTMKDAVGAVAYVGAANRANGVVARVEKTSPTESNKITVGNGGNGGVGFAFYQQEDFYASSTVNILNTVGYTLTSNIGNFLSVLITLLHEKYDFGRGLSLTRMANERIKLPTKPDGSIDFDFMESYMESFTK